MYGGTRANGQSVTDRARSGGRSCIIMTISYYLVHLKRNAGVQHHKSHHGGSIIQGYSSQISSTGISRRERRTYIRQGIVASYRYCVSSAIVRAGRAGSTCPGAWGAGSSRAANTCSFTLHLPVAPSASTQYTVHGRQPTGHNGIQRRLQGDSMGPQTPDTSLHGNGKRRFIKHHDLFIESENDRNTHRTDCRYTETG